MAQAEADTDRAGLPAGVRFISEAHQGEEVQVYIEEKGAEGHH